MKLSLGTAQLGMGYGISNHRGQPSPEAAREVLQRALDANVETLDTAPAYGNSEALIGGWLPPGTPFKLMTKALAARDPEQTALRFRRSLEDLNVASVHALLVHDVDELRGPEGSKLGDALVRLREEGLVERLGASIYDPADLEVAEGSMPLEVVQLPLNAFDQRFLRDGTIARLAGSGIEVHARSIFLQGLLLMSADEIPPGLGHAAPALEVFRAACSGADVSPLAGALGIASEAPGLQSVIVGVNTARELDECLAAVAESVPLDFEALQLDDPTIIDPRTWPAG